MILFEFSLSFISLYSKTPPTSPPPIGTVDLMPPSPALGLNRPLSEQHIYLPFYEGRTTTHLEPDTLHYEGDSVSRGDSRTVTLTRMYRQTEKAFGNQSPVLVILPGKFSLLHEAITHGMRL